MKAKPWQIVILVVGALALIGGIWFSLPRGRVRLPHKVYLIDVVSGEAFEADTSDRAIMVPAEHPESGLLSLVPMHKDENGAWVVSGRDLSALRGAPGVTVKAVDPRSGAVLVEVKDITRYRRKK